MLRHVTGTEVAATIEDRDVVITNPFTAWYSGMVGKMVRINGEVATVRFDGHGSVTVPVGMVVDI